MKKTMRMKTSMSGQKIPAASRLASARNILRAYRQGIFANAKSEVEFHQNLRAIISANLREDVKKIRILEIGCGQTASQTALFAADGADITGIDMEITTYQLSPKTLVKIFKTNGAERALKSFLRHSLFDKKFFFELATEYGKTVPFDSLNTMHMDATDLSFSDNHFDFVFSAWAFEHIEDVIVAVREMNRVLRSTGIAWVGIHLFPSLSGGHHVGWIRPDENSSTKVPPWDHLFDHKFPANTYLNKLRLDEYREIFHAHLNVLEEKLSFEGEHLLTAQTEEALQQKGYTRQDLTTRTVEFLCRKK